MSPLASIALGSAAWAAAHAWCHARCLALEAGDGEGLDGPRAGGALAAQISAGVDRGDVSPAVAERAMDAGLVPPAVAQRTRSGLYRRRYDRTAVADLPWLAAFIAAAALGALTSPAWSATLACATWAAMADVRFRVVPTPCAIALAALSLACRLPHGLAAAVVTLAVSGAALAAACALARRLGTSFGAGDAVIAACSITALGGPAGWVAFSLALLALLPIALIAPAPRPRAAGGGGRHLIPFGAYAAPALAFALVVAL